MKKQKKKEEKKLAEKEGDADGWFYVILGPDGRLASLECYDPTTAIRIVMSLNASFDLDNGEVYEKGYSIRQINYRQDVVGIEKDDGDEYWHSVQG